MLRGARLEKVLALCARVWQMYVLRRAFDLSILCCGGVAERSKAPVLKTGKRKLRGFESHLLRSLIR